MKETGVKIRIGAPVMDDKKDDEQPATDSYGRVIKTVAAKKAEKKEVKMIAGATAEQQKIKNFSAEEEDEKFVKHESFDHYVA